MLTFSFFFFFNDTATTEIYTLSLHDALPILVGVGAQRMGGDPCFPSSWHRDVGPGMHTLGREIEIKIRRHETQRDRKSTRLNSSHSQISYAVFCLKKKNKKNLPKSAYGHEHT